MAKELPRSGQDWEERDKFEGYKSDLLIGYDLSELTSAQKSVIKNSTNEEALMSNFVTLQRTIDISTLNQLLMWSNTKHT